MIEQQIDIATKDGNTTTFITHPERGGPFPVIIFSHDYGAPNRGYESMVANWTNPDAPRVTGLASAITRSADATSTWETAAAAGVAWRRSNPGANETASRSPGSSTFRATPKTTGSAQASRRR